jgi:ketosteroid isomerase-like protein
MKDCRICFKFGFPYGEYKTMNEDNRRLVETYLEHYNGMNIDPMLSLFTEDAEFQSVSNTDGIMKTTGRAQLSELARGSLQFFEQRRQTPISWVVSDDHVAVEIDYWCRLAKDLGSKKAGEEMNLRGASFFEIKGGLISRLTDYM